MAQSITTEGLYIGQLRQLPGVGSLTGLYKTAAAGPLQLKLDGLEGDRQADRGNHGGPERALNHYPAEHYELWRARYPAKAKEFVPGSLGENLSTRGLTEDTVRVGDIFRLGSARIQVSQPRSPCFKIAKRMGLPELAREVAAAGLSGWLYRVLEPGTVAPTDVPELETPAVHGVTLAQLWTVRNDRRPTQEALAQMAGLTELAEAWRDGYRSRLEWFSR